MTLRLRIIVTFTLITALILLSFATVIYISAENNREKEFFDMLEKEAVTKANLYLEAEIDAQTLQNIYLNNRKILNEVEVAVYDFDRNLQYHDAVELDFVKETPQLFDEISQKRKVTFYQEGWQVIGILYEHSKGKFFVTAAAFDKYGYNKMNTLAQNMVVVFLIALALIIVVGYVFSKKIFAPIQQMILKANEISGNKLNLRLPRNNDTDELSQLAITFNKMLDRLENSFEAQKHFVSNISHELKTPIAAIIAELELAKEQTLDTEQVEKLINLTLDDVKKTNRLINSLLDLAKASYDESEIVFKPCRIDEILLDAVETIQKANKYYKIELHIDEDIEDEITLKANEYLLKIAFVNLIENACKYSPDQKCIIHLKLESDKLKVQFIDKGPGINSEELERIFEPFYRGSNQQLSQGSGIGLYLTRKIVDIHKAQISVKSEPGKGSVFEVALGDTYFVN